MLGVASNLDQFLAMEAIESIGAGRRLCSGSLRREDAETTVRAMLEDEAHRVAAARARDALRGYDAIARFHGLLERALGRAP